MKPRLTLLLGCLLLPTIPAPIPAAAQDRTRPGGDGDVSLKLEIERAVAAGVEFLEARQDARTGAWSDPSLPALTALPVSAILGDPSLDPGAPLPDTVEKGYDFILGHAKPDGGLYDKGLATYNTALCLMALVQSGKEEHLPVIAGGRRFLIDQQQDYGEPGETDNLFDGGIGYGGSYEHSDLSNTHLALEALHYSQKALADTEFDNSDEIDLDWNAAIDFVSRIQNSEKTIEKLGDWVGLREEDRGGFVYFPGDTKSDEIVLKTDDGEKTALRSYGSMTYAGLLAFIYADMDRDDPRIAAAMDWLRKNFTLEENPGLDAQGLFYYYHTMSKALAVTGTKEFVTPEGKRVDWKEELALELMERQQRDGSWINPDSNRWMEDDPILVTAYALLALEHVHRAL
ncbi:MAG: prenyltransferase/squalene oxidase repeat-containing protein [Verrucomicrobiales bacterium]